uniref:Uncharacterized protein n=1 Tax=Tremella fuciformis TaxID=64657 RepID=D5KXZ8_9TREE|nr:unknown [Tremella fuciformis]
MEISCCAPRLEQPAKGERTRMHGIYTWVLRRIIARREIDTRSVIGIGQHENLEPCRLSPTSCASFRPRTMSPEETTAAARSIYSCSAESLSSTRRLGGRYRRSFSIPELRCTRHPMILLMMSRPGLTSSADVPSSSCRSIDSRAPDVPARIRTYPTHTPLLGPCQ